MFSRCETLNIWCRGPFPDPTEFEAVMFVQTLRQRVIFASSADVFFWVFFAFGEEDGSARAADRVAAFTNTTRKSPCRAVQNFSVKRQENRSTEEGE